ncbi:MAG: DJ-1/PfpI family protein [Erysipelotrichaceae bacterium]|nr:DJ-1/PfpI family protein [Erysipelotrichaceae bacterium]
MKAIILVTQGLEECEALVTYDLLYRAGIEVKLVGLSDTIVSSHEVTFLPHLLIDEIDPENYDCLILPGGMPGTLNLEKDERVQKLIDRFVESDKYVCAICAAPSILLHKGLLNDRHFVCYPGFENGQFPAHAKAIRDGKFITGKGLGAAFEFAYEIISVLISEDKAKEVLDKTQY